MVLPKHWRYKEKYKYLLEDLVSIFPDDFKEHFFSYQFYFPSSYVDIGEGYIDRTSKRIEIGHIHHPIYFSELFLYYSFMLLKEYSEEENVLSNDLLKIPDASLAIYVIYPKTFSELSKRNSLWREIGDIFDNLLNLSEEKRERIYSRIRCLCSYYENNNSRPRPIDDLFFGQSRGYLSKIDKTSKELRNFLNLERKEILNYLHFKPK